MKRDDAGVDGLAAITSRAILRDDPGPNLDFHPEAQHAREDGPARHAALELVDFGAGLVHVEGADYDQSWVGREVPHGDRDALDDVFVYRVDVVFELCGDWDDGR